MLYKYFFFFSEIINHDARAKTNTQQYIHKYQPMRKNSKAKQVKIGMAAPMSVKPLSVRVAE